MSVRTYKELDAWKLAMNLVETTYELTKHFPDEEKYGLKAQMRRCAVSIPSNIAEGQARGTVRSGLHFIRIAIGSAAELDTQVEAALRLRFLKTEGASDAVSKIERGRQLLYGMRREHQRRLAGAGATLTSICLLAVGLLRVLG
jgi:four helix bundle protein